LKSESEVTQGHRQPAYAFLLASGYSNFVFKMHRFCDISLWTTVSWPWNTD